MSRSQIANATQPPGTIASTTRRVFCSTVAAFSGEAILLSSTRLLRALGLSGQAPSSPPATPTRPDVAAIDHDRILAAAQNYLTEKPTPITSLPSPNSPGTPHDYYSEAEPDPDPNAPPAKPGSAAPAPPFTAHRDALFAMGLRVPALAAAGLLTADPQYSQHAALHLRAWFIDPATKMNPRLDYGHVPAISPTTTSTTLTSKPPPGGTVEGILETLPLVEVAQAIPFLAASGALTDSDLTALQTWFSAYLHWLTDPQDSGPRLAALARDRKDHHGVSWMLQVSAYTLFTTPETGAPRAESKSMDDLRHRFRTVTLRAQISSEGVFTHELTSATPYRDSLFSLDMIAAICHLISTRFESVWEYQLDDGPGMRAAIAYHFPFIANRSRWPFRADNVNFTQLPSRRASLLLAAPIYQRPEYAALWKSLPPDPASPEVLRTLPIHQPLLWVRQPPRAAREQF
jgi:hypothetical protein